MPFDFIAYLQELGVDVEYTESCFKLKFENGSCVVIVPEKDIYDECILKVKLF